MPTKQQIREFLSREYRAERFEGRDGSVWGVGYSANIVDAYAQDLAETGFAFIGRHESIRGKPVKFDADLKICLGN